MTHCAFTVIAGHDWEQNQAVQLDTGFIILTASRKKLVLTLVVLALMLDSFLPEEDVGWGGWQSVSRPGRVPHDA